MKPDRTIRKFCFTLVACCLLVACSESAPNPEDDSGAKEIKTKTKSSLDLPELELFSNARRQYDSSLYSIAQESFEALRDNYPTGPYAEFAELKIAEAHFKTTDYKAAAIAYEEFTKNRPASSAVPYALLRAGRSYELSSAGVGRDPTPLQKAVELYNSLIERFPNSVYIAGAQYFKRGVEELLAAYEQKIITFYDEREKAQASSARDKEFSKRFGAKSDEYEAKEYDKLIALGVGPVSEDKVRIAKRTLQNLHAPTGATVARSGILEAPPVLEAGKFQVSAVSCDAKERLVVLTLDPKPIEGVSSLEPTRRGNALELRVENLTTQGEETKTYTCFSEGDMTISSSGVMTLNSTLPSATALYIENPPRIILRLPEE